MAEVFGGELEEARDKKRSWPCQQQAPPASQAFRPQASLVLYTQTTADGAPTWLFYDRCIFEIIENHYISEFLRDIHLIVI